MYHISFQFLFELFHVTNKYLEVYTLDTNRNAKQISNYYCLLVNNT